MYYKGVLKMSNVFKYDAGRFNIQSVLLTLSNNLMQANLG